LHIVGEILCDIHFASYFKVNILYYNNYAEFDDDEGCIPEEFPRGLSLHFVGFALVHHSTWTVKHLRIWSIRYSLF